MFYRLRSLLAYLFSLIPGAYRVEAALRYLSKCFSNAENYNQAFNGERRASVFVIALLGQSPVVYDVGANVGEWSEAILKYCPAANVQAFEMIPAFAERVRQRLAGWQKAAVHDLGLSDIDQSLMAYQAGEGASISAHDYGTKQKVPVSIRVVRGDDYLAAQALPLPGFIKIDVEGHELKVLKGLSGTIQKARPFVQFEYGKHYINERVYLKDVFGFFEPLEYKIFQIFPTRLVLRTWSPALENFWTTNFMAVPEEKAKAFA